MWEDTPGILLNNPPTPFRVLNHVLRYLPADLIIRDIAVSGLWYAPGQVQLAQYLWERIRWEFKEQGTVIAASFDPRDPARQVVRLKPWHQPRIKTTIAINGPTPLDRSRLLYSFGRV